MILAYSNISDPIVICLLDEQKILRDTTTIPVPEKRSRKRPNLLAGIADILKKNSQTHSDVSRIFFVNGPGRFTPVRTACLIANTFARESGIGLCTISAKEFEQSSGDFEKLIQEKEFHEVDFARPVFSGPPSIGKIGDK